MRWRMRAFLKNTRGAVTVFVSLLLIPAMLVSGTAVDLVRIHTARGIIQDANQLAANSMLAQYNALLYDIYGLFGIAQDDPILWALLDEYIKVSVFGEERQDKSLGTLQVFYGANLSLEEPFFPDDKNLRNEEVLRRQIEEYMKFRGPILLVKEFIDALTGNTIMEDAAIIEEKLEIDSAIADLYDKYRELYNAIVAADKCDQIAGGIVGATVGTVSSGLTLIHKQFVDLLECYQEWDYWRNSKNPFAAQYMAELELKNRAILKNIESYVVGGLTGSEWRFGSGRWGKQGSSQGLNRTIENSKTSADNFKPRFDLVVTLAREIDSMKDGLSRKIDDLEQKLLSREADDELRRAFMDRHGSPPKSIIERYRDLLKWDIEPMATAFKNGGYDYIDNVMKPLLDSVRFRNRLNDRARSLSREELGRIVSDSRFAMVSYVSPGSSNAAYFAGFPENSVTYLVPPGFKRFSEHPGGNGEFFAELRAMMNQPNIPPVKLYEGQGDAAGADSGTKQRNMIEDLLRLVDAAYAGLANEPLGARYINDDMTPQVEAMNIFEIAKTLPQALSAPVLRTIQDPLGALAGLGDYVLLLTYSTSMFSNYTTSKPGSIGKTVAELSESDFTKTISGVPLSPRVNYFFQSEWEYLYEGSDNAETNLSAVGNLIYKLRLVCNYITVFSVSEITTIVDNIKIAFAWAPPLGIMLGELARAAFVAAESVVDVAALRSGYKVPLFKSAAAGEWTCTPRKLLNVLGNIVRGETITGDSFRNAKGLSYSHYMLFFFMTKTIVYIGKDGDAANELAKRTGNLIEWNIINYQSNSNSNERLMAGALDEAGRFRLLDMKTDFSITTTVDFRMLFLSMAFARNFSDSRGIGMPSTLPMTVTDYRGY